MRKREKERERGFTASQPVDCCPTTDKYLDTREAMRKQVMVAALRLAERVVCVCVCACNGELRGLQGMCATQQGLRV